jgi:hypothetical protein
VLLHTSTHPPAPQNLVLLSFPIGHTFPSEWCRCVSFSSTASYFNPRACSIASEGQSVAIGRRPCQHRSNTRTAPNVFYRCEQSFFGPALHQRDVWARGLQCSSKMLQGHGVAAHAASSSPRVGLRLCYEDGIYTLSLVRSCADPARPQYSSSQLVRTFCRCPSCS